MVVPPRVIVMKVGLHLGEAWDSILRRKLAEERDIAVVHWGYGGSVCHPMTQVRSFAAQDLDPVAVLMIRTPSDFFGSTTPAVAESTNGIHWTPISSGVVTTGKHALIVRSLRPTDEQLDLGAYEVAIGSKTGTALPAYLRGCVDKACARVAGHRSAPNRGLLRKWTRADAGEHRGIGCLTTQNLHRGFDSRRRLSDHDAPGRRLSGP